jgi:hypothetical protein
MGENKFKISLHRHADEDQLKDKQEGITNSSFNM